MSSARARGWSFTVNNFTTEQYELLQEKIEEDVSCLYAIIGKERAPGTGTPHLQGYFYFGSIKSFKQIKDFLPHGAHIERAMGTSKQNRDYCIKEGNFWEHGGCPEQGKRTDMDDCRNIVRETGSLRYVIESGAGYQCVKYASTILPFYEPIREWKPRVLWFWGGTGTGKTRAALNLFSEPTNRWVSGSNAKWFDGYDGQPNVLLDDFRPSTWPFPILLRMLDRYEFRVEFKGGHRQFLAKMIIITCHSPPNMCVWGEGEDVEQLLRRLDGIYQFPMPLNVLTDNIENFIATVPDENSSVSRGSTVTLASSSSSSGRFDTTLGPGFAPHAVNSVNPYKGHVLSAAASSSSSGPQYGSDSQPL